MTNKIAVLIVTRNRPLELEVCLRSILKNSDSDYQILIADQSDNNQTLQVVKNLASNRIKIIKMKVKGKSRGLNLLINKAQSEILTFTDDDCLVKPDWLKQIAQTYHQFPHLAGVFGNTFPYQPQHHPDQFCPSTFKTAAFSLHTFADFHYYQVGLGNNMSLRRSVLKKVGNFKEWLGPGAIGENGEESEMVLRILSSGQTLATNPKMILFHNRWLDYEQERHLQAKYTLGFIAFLSYYLLTKNGLHALTFIKVKVQERLRPALGSIVGSIKTTTTETRFLLQEIGAILRGLTIGLMQAIREKLSK